MTNTRQQALEALLDVFRGKALTKRSVESRATSLDRRDRSFLMEIVYGVVRFRDRLDWILRHFLRNPAKLGAATINNLRVASYQILFMRVPEWAAVNEAVEIEKRSAGTEGKPQLVNAVLRNLIRQKDRFSSPFESDNPVLRISVNTSHPKWLVKRWIRRFGEEEAERLALANNEVPKMTMRVNTLKANREELLEILSREGVAAEPTRYSPDGIMLKELVAYHELAFIRGLFVVQDEASQFITYLLGPRPGERILDACAAPGGKTTHAAQMMKDTGEIVAVEKDPGRIYRLAENVQTLGITSVKVVNADIAELEGVGLFDRVLVDAPCSATGIIRKNPDVKYRHDAKDLLEYKSRQTALLHSASRFLKEGGRLVYSVCSTEPEEGEAAVNDFLKTAQDFRIIDTDVPFLKDFMDKGFLRTYPHRHNIDGFIGVALCKRT